MEFKDDGKPKQMTWKVFRPAPKPKPEPMVAPQKIILFPSTRIPSPTQNPGNAPRISNGLIHQKPASTPGSPLQPKRGQITVGVNHQKPASTLDSPLKPKRGPIAGNPNQMESGDQISGRPRRTGNLGPWQTTTIINKCITCLIISIIVLAILFLLTLALIFSNFSLVTGII